MTGASRRVDPGDASICEHAHPDGRFSLASARLRRDRAAHYSISAHRIPPATASGLQHHRFTDVLVHGVLSGILLQGIARR
jgi:hypothetical protein